MESAPQSTINHNAVIYFASDSLNPPLPPRERRTRKTKPSPAQKGGLKSAGTLPKSPPRRNAAQPVIGRIRQVFASERPVSANTLEMAVGQARQRDLVPLPVQKPRGRFACDHGPDRGHGHACDRCRTRERLEAILRDGAQNLVVVAAGDDFVDDDGAARQQYCNGCR